MKILIAHEERLYAQALKALLKNATVDHIHVDFVHSEDDFYKAVSDEKYDTIIVSGSFNQLGGAEVLIKASSNVSDAYKIILSTFHNRIEVMKAFSIRASIIDCSYNRGTKLKELIFSNKKEIYISPTILGKLGIKFKANSKRNFDLTKVEMEILYYLCLDYSNEEIAKVTYRSKRTIDGYRQKIKRKIGAKGMAGLIIFAIKTGIYNIDKEI